LFEEGQDLLMSTVCFSFSFVPDGFEIVAVDPADLDGAGHTMSRVGLDLDLLTQILFNVVLQPSSRTSISSRSTVLDVDKLSHNKIMNTSTQTEFKYSEHIC